ncbi:MAG: metallophosphoesterase, partial [Ferruginibacter sp.]|nr:metallophosphoesterase [Ferruginibacter sp.]
MHQKTPYNKDGFLANIGRIGILLCALLSAHTLTKAQDPISGPPTTEMVFISDTQQPLWVETIIHKQNRNTAATADLFREILQRKPQSIYMLGDVVGLGSKNKKWKNVDQFLDSCKGMGACVSGLLGNHELMGRRRKKGEANFTKRFPLSVRTGYVSVTDSVAVILLNSNFNALSKASRKKQQDWYEKTIAKLDETDSIRAVIVTCHHSPFSNSRVVKGSTPVQQSFVPAYIQSKKAQLFIAGHAHAFEHFMVQGKDFLVIGGGGGIHQRLSEGPK